jgi:hypothetical protein
MPVLLNAEEVLGLGNAVEVLALYAVEAFGL